MGTFFNGMLFAVIIGLITWFWSGSVGVGAVMAVAMTTITDVVAFVVSGRAGGRGDTV